MEPPCLLFRMKYRSANVDGLKQLPRKPDPEVVAHRMQASQRAFSDRFSSVKEMGVHRPMGK